MPKAASEAGQFVKKASDVFATDKSGNVFKGFHIWTDTAPAVRANPDILFAKCLVLPGSSTSVFKCQQVEPEPSNEEFEVKQENAFNLNSNLDPMTFPDIGMIPHTNVPCVLDFLRQRFMNKQIYSTAEPLLVAINPFVDLGNTTDAVVAEYHAAVDASKLPPHVFSIARTAQENLQGVGKSQTIIVCGESGAGKTEATKHVMRYFAACKGRDADLRIQKAVLAANPVLEAFGNAKTLRNNNSSRFGRFMQLQLGVEGGIFGGKVLNFLLEKSRVVSQLDDERSYHIFYQLLKGAPSDLKARLGLRELSQYSSLNPSCFSVETIDDVAEYKEVVTALQTMQITDEEQESVFSLVAGILEMGNVQFENVSKAAGQEGAAITSQTRDSLDKACRLLYLDTASIEEGLTVKITTAGGSTVRGFWSADDARTLRESLTKAIYEKLFFWLVTKLNLTIEPEGGFVSFMGMLDIFGFEVFKNNSLEQLFINITNELLQRNFVDVVFERETKLYRAEGISSADLTWTSNQEVIDMLIGKKGSLMSSLEDQCLAPGGTDEKVLSLAFQTLKDNPKLKKGKLGANLYFMVAHTIGDIQYNVEGFISKNKDILRAELAEVVTASSNLVAKELFAGVVIERGKLAKGQLIGSQFLASLSNLISLINSTEPHFIRCIKPNEEKKPLLLTSSKTLIQLHALSILEALQLRNLGYAYRRTFSEFLHQFKFIDLGIAEDSSLDPKDGASKLFDSAGVKDGWQIGKTMVFMKSETMKLMAQRQRESLSAWDPLINLLESAFVRKQCAAKLINTIPGLVRFQAQARRFSMLH